jgi:hypothetical protein
MHYPSKATSDPQGTLGIGLPRPPLSQFYNTNGVYMNLETGNEGFGQTFSDHQTASHNAIHAPADPVLRERKLMSAPRVMRAITLLFRTFLTWIVIVITLLILSITWLFTIRDKKDWTDKNRRKRLLLIISK